MTVSRSAPTGRYLLRLKTRWRDGTTHLQFEPIELMERLAAQIPKPRVNLVLYAGVLAPRSSGEPTPMPAPVARISSAPHQNRRGVRWQ
jgi:hypothetical protein